MQTQTDDSPLLRKWMTGNRFHLISAAKIAVIYLAVGALWILLTDRLLLRILKDPQALTQFQTYKGWVFVVGTGLLIFTLCTRHFAELLRHYRNELALRRQLESFAWQTATILAETVERKDGYTGAHCERIARRAEAVGRAMGLSKQRCEHLYYAGLVHDIGKVEIPDAILNKPEPLTDEEWEQMKTHARVGADLLRPLNPLRPVADIVEQHHERWDGSGYPKGLQGEEIRLEARILAVVDAYDAMTTDRPYQSRCEPTEALDELQQCAGQQFDPNVVRTLAQQLNPETGDIQREN